MNVVDYRDAAGVRRWITCETRRQAEAVLSERLRDSRQPIQPAVDPDITVAHYAERWLALIGAGVKPRTIEGHRTALRLHLLPTFGRVKVRLLQKGHIKTLLAELLQRGWVKRITKDGVTQEVRLPLKRGSVRIIHTTLRAMLYAAVDDGVIVANPAERLGRHLKLVPAPATRQEEIKAMTREQLAAFLAAATAADARGEDCRLYPFFLSWPARACGSAKRSLSSGPTSTSPAGRSVWREPSRMDASTRPRAGTGAPST